MQEKQPTSEVIVLSNHPLMFTREDRDVLALLRDHPKSCFESVDDFVIRHLFEIFGAWWKYKPGRSPCHPEFRGFHSSQCINFSQIAKYPLLVNFFSTLLVEKIVGALSKRANCNTYSYVVVPLDYGAGEIIPSVVNCLQQKLPRSCAVRVEQLSMSNSVVLSSTVNNGEVRIYIRSIVIPQSLGVDTLLLHSYHSTGTEPLLATIMDRRPGNPVQGVVSLVQDSSLNVFNVGDGDECPLCLVGSKPLSMADVHTDSSIWLQLTGRSA